jgi:5,10-methylenetetrahydromethanopterin reductase
VRLDSVGVVLPTRYPEPLPRYVALAGRADALGYGTVWSTETAAADAVALAAACAMTTQRVRIGTGVIPIATRTPPLMAMGALTLQELSQGRAILGLGASTPAILGDWHGLPDDRLVDRLRETVAAVRSAADSRDFCGQRLNSRGFHLALSGERPLPPVYLAALGPRAVGLAAQVADGAILTLSSADHLERIAAQLRAVNLAGRLVAYVRVSIGRPVAAPREWMRHELAWYGSSAAYRAHFRRQGFEAEMRAVELAQQDCRTVAVDAISDAMCDRLSITGTPAQARDQIERLLAVGVDEVACYFMDAEREGVDGMINQLELLAAG